MLFWISVLKVANFTLCEPGVLSVAIGDLFFLQNLDETHGIQLLIKGKHVSTLKVKRLRIDSTIAFSFVASLFF